MLHSSPITCHVVLCCYSPSLASFPHSCSQITIRKQNIWAGCLPCQHTSRVSFHQYRQIPLKVYGQPGIKILTSNGLISLLFPLDNCFTNFRIVSKKITKSPTKDMHCWLVQLVLSKVPSFRITCIAVCLQCLQSRAAIKCHCNRHIRSAISAILKN